MSTFVAATLAGRRVRLRPRMSSNDAFDEFTADPLDESGVLAGEVNWRGLYGTNSLLPASDVLRLAEEAANETASLRGLFDGFHERLFDAVIHGYALREQDAARTEQARPWSEVSLDAARGMISKSLGGLPVRIRLGPSRHHRSQRSSFGQALQKVVLGRNRKVGRGLRVIVGPSQAESMRLLVQVENDEAERRRRTLNRFVHRLFPAPWRPEVSYACFRDQRTRARLGQTRLDGSSLVRPTGDVTRWTPISTSKEDA
jgi:hypothetical protein